MAITDEQLVNWFTFHDCAPGSDPAKGYAAINEASLNLAKVIRDYSPASADQSDAIRKVREARMTANAAIACGGK
jgi:hypothetical protein